MLGKAAARPILVLALSYLLIFNPWLTPEAKALCNQYSVLLAQIQNQTECLINGTQPFQPHLNLNATCGPAICPEPSGT